MISVVILGFGNVGKHLYRAFSNAKDVQVIQVYNRSPFSSEILAATTQRLSQLEDADVYIISIPDDEISKFSEKLLIKNKLVVHTSGSLAMAQLSQKNRKGVFYALQTFSRDRLVDFKDIPICIEAANYKDLKALRSLGLCISSKVVEVDSQQRKKLHLAAVFVNNFVNHLYYISEKIVTEENLDFQLLKPLIQETAKKIELLSPINAQTGPAKREDKKTIDSHLGMLGEENKELYHMFTKAIKNQSKKV